MNLVSLFGFLIIIFIALVSIIVTFHFYNKYSLRFYRTFAYFLICVNLRTFLPVIGKHLTEIIFRNQAMEAAAKLKFAMIFNFIAMPFQLLFLFFLFVFFRDIFGKPMTRNLKIISLFSGLALAVLAISGYIDFFSPNPSFSSDLIQIVLSILIPLIVISSISQGFFYLKDIEDPRHRKMLLIFTSLFLVISTVIALNIMRNTGVLSDIIVLLPWGLILLILMVKKLNGFYLLKPNSLEKSGNLERIYRKYKISKREQELIAMICLGKTNRDIEDALFISIHTVRNHIYNIFQKLNIKNRVELINFIRLETSSAPPHSTRLRSDTREQP